MSSLKESIRGRLWQRPRRRRIAPFAFFAALHSTNLAISNQPAFAYMAFRSRVSNARVRSPLRPFFRYELVLDLAQSSEPFVDEYGHPIEEKRIDYPGAGTLGDIMSSDEGYRINLSRKDGDLLENCTSVGTVVDEGLVTTTGGTLQTRFGSMIPGLTPMERITLTSNGNLQRIFSSYYDVPVHVHVDQCEMRQGGSEQQNEIVPRADANEDHVAVWDRKVHLSVHKSRFCTALSEVTVRCPTCVRLVHSKNIGIGQLFRHLDRLPTFSLLDAGRNDDGGLWRKYTLESDELSCVVREDFALNAWNMEPDMAADGKWRNNGQLLQESK